MTGPQNNSDSNLSPDFEKVRRFWQTPQVEQSLVRYDIESSLAHIKMLGETGIIELEIANRVGEALEQIRQELAAGKPFLLSEDMDIHGGLERRLKEIVGDLALSLRVAKSRNDQIATDIRLWLREALWEIADDLSGLREALLDLAERDLDIVMPGYTHMQPAMPMLLAHWWLANEARLRRDCGRLADLYRRLNVLPLGAGVLAGTNQPIDRSLVARYLGFDGVIENSLDAVSDRDYLVEFGSFAALVGVHLSQMAAELLLWTTQEFAFVRLRSAFVFRSQSMPQKRNPELLEILRSRPSTIYGRLQEFLAELKGVPVSFSQDLQECLPGLMDTVEHLKFLLELATVLLSAIEPDAARMKEMASKDLTNSRNALDFLLSRGLPPDRSSQIVEALVKYCRQRDKYLSDLALSEWQQFSPAFDSEIYKHVTIDQSVGSMSSFGGTSQEQVAQALERARQALVKDRERQPRAGNLQLPVRELEGI